MKKQKNLSLPNDSNPLETPVQPISAHQQNCLICRSRQEIGTFPDVNLKSQATKEPSHSTVIKTCTTSTLLLYTLQNIAT